MKPMRRIAALTTLVPPILAACGAAPEPGPEDLPEVAAPGAALLIWGGTIYAESDATVEALVLREGRVSFAGDLAAATRDAGPGAAALDLKGATLVPGLQDAHGHLSGLGALLEEVDLTTTRSYDEVIDLIVARAEDLPPGTWITGRGWDQTRWPDAAFPQHGPLSERVPYHPVLVRRVDGHAALANARALELAGLDGVLDPVPSVEGGRVHVDSAGRATGVLIDTAMGLVSAKVPPPDPGAARRRFLAAQDRVFSEGLTCVHDMGLSPAEVELLEELEASGELRLQVRGYLWGNSGLEGPRVATLAAAPRRGAMRLVGVKLMIDGALGSRGAALLEPYTDAPHEVGLMRMEQVELNRLVARCGELGLQPATHAIGDRGNRSVLNAYARQAEIDAGFLDLRPRVEHAQVVAPGDWERFAAMGVIPSMQPRHATSDMRWAEERVGPDRLAGAYAWRRLEAENAPLAFGSDFPVEPSAPLLGLYAARTRQDEDGQPLGGWLPEQRVDGAGALEGFTAGAAYAVGEEDERGKLLAGYHADFTVLSVDPVTCEPSALLDARVLLTAIEGDIVYDAR